jgi:RNA polymerase sigma factor (sigma-70 family)
MRSQDYLQHEKDLLDKAQADNSNFDHLYTYFVNDVYRFSYSILNNQHDAEDVTSQTFIEFYKKINEFEWKNISVKYWLFRTARNISYNKLKLPASTTLDENTDVEIYTEISFVDEIMHKDLIEKVKEEIQKLTLLEQEIINLRIWEAMGFKEIAILHETSEDTTKKRFYRSIDKVRKNLIARKIKAFASLPVLFTGIFLVGATPAYAAPASLTSSTMFSSLAITKQTTMTTFKTFLASKAGIASIGGLLILAVIAGTTGYIIANKDNKDSDKQAQTTVTPSATVEPTVVASPTIEPVSITTAPQATSTLSTTAAAVPTVTMQTYVDTDIKASFSYPSNYTVTVGTFTPFQNIDNEKLPFANKTINIKSDKGSTFTIIFNSTPGGCYSENPSQVDAVLKNTHTNKYIARSRSKETPGYSSRIEYYEYSSSINGQGYVCQRMFEYNSYPEFGDKAGFFILMFDNTNVSNDELTVYDNIVKSFKRL